MTAHPTMNDLLGLLDRWRHFPAFPLEARSEVFFALFLPTVLENSKCVGVKVKSQIIPQFPLKKEDNNQSNNVDFFALSEDRKKGYLIELKTDMRSISKKQVCYLKRAKEKCVSGILDDFKIIFESTYDKKFARQKYFHMAHVLSELRLIGPLSALQGAMYPDSPSGVDRPEVKELINKICILKPPRNLEVIYIQPREPENPKDKVDGFKYIYFEEFADIIIKGQGDIGRMFACYLRKWSNDPAGHPPSEMSDCKC